MSGGDGEFSKFLRIRGEQSLYCRDFDQGDEIDPRSLEVPYAGAMWKSLDPAECRRRVARTPVMRICIEVDGTPVAYPLNGILDGDDVVCRVEIDSALAKSAPCRASVEADEVFDDEREGWSVIGKGRLRDVTQAIDIRAEALRRLVVTPWASGEKAVWLALSVETWTGRSLRQ